VNTLAIDSSSNVLSVALETETEIFHEEADKSNSHSELLMECVDDLCKSAGIKPADLSLVACMKGPGSFTGLRIGFSAAKGIALALGIPVIAVPTLDCLAEPFSTRPGLVLPVLDAKKGCFFAAFYRKGERLTDFLDANPVEIIKTATKIMLSPEEPVLLTGSGAELLQSRFKEQFPEELVFIKNISLDDKFARGRARELLKIIKNAKFSMVNDIEGVPVYLRKSDAELNFKEGG
jgi:tRNA threonylcarbamoyladenosine biosynthesis protein TsaB